MEKMVLGKLAKCKSMKQEHFLTSYTKINSELFKKQNVRHDTVKLKITLAKCTLTETVTIFS